MNKYIEEFCKQNPNITLECGNPKCKHKFNVKTKEFLKVRSFPHKCDKCGEETSYDTSQLQKDIMKIIQQLDIKLK